MGFWIHITQPGDTIFLYNGTQPTQNQTITLHPGWNMVGYPSLSNRNRTAALNNIVFDTDVDAIWPFNAATQTWQEIGSTDYFELGRGYWIHSKVTEDLGCSPVKEKKKELMKSTYLKDSLRIKKKERVLDTSK